MLCSARGWGALFPAVRLMVRVSDQCKWASKRKIFSQNSSSLLPASIRRRLPSSPPRPPSAGGLRGAVVVLHHRDALRGAVEGRHHVGPLDAGQCGTEQPQGGALTLGPGGQEGASRRLAAPKQVQLLGFVAQRGAQLPPTAAAASLLQEALHLLLPVGGQVDVQPCVLLAVPLSACGKKDTKENQ